jgi:hypothetical protein
MGRVLRWAQLLSTVDADALDAEDREVLVTGVIVGYASAFRDESLGEDEWVPADPGQAELHAALLDSLRSWYARREERDVSGDYGRRAGLKFFLGLPSEVWVRIADLADAQTARMRELAGRGEGGLAGNAEEREGLRRLIDRRRREQLLVDAGGSTQWSGA